MAGRLRACPWLSMLIGVALSAYAYAGKPPRQGKTTRSPHGFLTGPFDSSQERLPPGFRGHDLRGLSIFLDQTIEPSLKKNEFETEGEYRDRLNRLETEPFWGAMRMKDSFAFCLSPELGVLGGPEYDAAGETFDWKLIGHSTWEGLTTIPDPYFTNLCVHDFTDLGSYVATNAFGATVKVDKWASTYVCLRFPMNMQAQDSQVVRRDGSSIVLHFQVPRPEAREVKDRLRVLLVGRVVDLQTKRGGELVKPTIDKPQDVLYFYQHIKFLPTEIWVFDQVSGAVYLRTAVTFPPT